MKLTKFVHACLLAETEDKVVLFDPGKFSWESGLFSVESLSKLDAVVITHEHFDHFHMPFVSAVIEKFPDAVIVTTPDVADKLRSEGLSNVTTESLPYLEVFSTVSHASLDPLGEAPQNIAVHFADQFTVGGDRHDLEETKDILALTVTAPWGSMLEAVRMAMRLKPKQIIPVHDWHWNDEARNGAYDSLGAFFTANGIQFIKPVDGQAVEFI